MCIRDRVIAPLRRTHPDTSASGSENMDPAVEIALISDGEMVTPVVKMNPERRFRQVVKWPLAKWRAWRMPAASVEPAVVTETVDRVPPVSYTHLDVYKRQRSCGGNG